jgi:hypothetical protein
VQVLIPILIVIVIALVVAVGALIMSRRAPAVTVEQVVPDASPKQSFPEPPPMNDLEAALEKVTDSAGRPIRDRIDAETDHVEELRVPDDTGPLLRRALDHVATPATTEAPGEVLAAGDPADDGVADEDSSGTPET